MTHTVLLGDGDVCVAKEEKRERLSSSFLYLPFAAFVQKHPTASSNGHLSLFRGGGRGFAIHTCSVGVVDVSNAVYGHDNRIEVGKDRNAHFNILLHTLKYGRRIVDA